MNITDYTKIIETYEHLRENTENIKEIINNYKNEAETIEVEIEELKAKCTKLKYEDFETQAEDNNGSADAAARHSASQSIASVPGVFKIDQLDEVAKSKFENDAVDILEQEFLKSSKLRMSKENEVIKISNILQSACTTVSRIMYQLDKNKEKNVEIGKDNVVEALSKLGMNLERRLAYIHTKNKAVKDENVLMVSF